MVVGGHGGSQGYHEAGGEGEERQLSLRKRSGGRQAAVGDPLGRWDARLARIRFMNQLESRTGVPKVVWAVGAFCTAIALVGAGMGVERVVGIVAFVYPFYATFKTMKGQDLQEHMFWLMYWAVFGTFTFVETISDTIFFWFPYYTEAKIVFLVYCFLPKSRGAVAVYRQMLRPVLQAREGLIDRVLLRIEEFCGQTAKEMRDLASESIVSLVMNFRRKRPRRARRSF